MPGLKFFIFIGEVFSEPLLSLILFPVLAGIVCLFIPKTFNQARAVVATAATLLMTILAWHLFSAVRFLAPLKGMQLAEETWRGLELSLDSLSSFILLATTVFGFLISLYSIGFMKHSARQREYYAYLLWTVGISCGVLLVNNLILLLIFWGLLGLTLFVMVGIDGPEAAAAAKKSFVVIGASDCLLMLGVIIVWKLTHTFAMDQISLPFKGELSYVAFLCFVAAAFAKAGAMPFHSWVPDAGEKGPASVAAFLPASLDKLLGIYLLARVATGMFKMTIAMNTLLMVFGAITVICAVMMALVQHDLKRLLSYHAVSQVGYMVLGIGTGSVIGLVGGLFHMLNNAIYKSCLFLCAGSVEKQAGTTDLDRMGGMAGAMPVTFVSCLIAALAISGIPPLNGFASKWLVYQAIVDSRSSGGLWIIWLSVAMFGSALTLASFVKVIHATFLRKADPSLAKKQIKEAPLTMVVPMITLAALCVLFGVLAWRIPLEHFIFPAVTRIHPQAQEVWVPGWGAAPATVLLLSACAVGVVLYLATIPGKTRVCSTYTGGEIMAEPYISGEPRRPERDVEVTGTDFYETVERMQPFRTIYEIAKNKMFDLYDVVTGIIFYFVEPLRRAHIGILPVYLTWFLVGFLGVLWVLIFGMKLI